MGNSTKNYIFPPPPQIINFAIITKYMRALQIPTMTNLVSNYRTNLVFEWYLNTIKVHLVILLFTFCFVFCKNTQSLSLIISHSSAFPHKFILE